MNHDPTQPALRLGFIGGSLKSAVGYAHRTACELDGAWSIEAGCFSAKSEDNRTTALAYGVCPERTYTDWRTLLEKEQGRLDAVVVLTPTPTHAEIVQAFLSAGFPVLCEKAMAMNSWEASEIIATRDAARGFLAMTYNYSGYPMVRELRSMIQRGLLGRILHFQAEMPQEGFRRLDSAGHKPTPQAWRLADQSIPTLHLDLGVHLHHLLHYVTGERPLEVCADQATYGWFEVVDNVTCMCRYTGNIQGQIWFSKCALGHRNGLRLRIYGSEASAEWFQMNPEEILVNYADGRRQILDRAAQVEQAHLARYNRFKAGHPAGFIEAFANLYGDIANSLQTYRATGAWMTGEVYGAELAREGLSMLEAMVGSTTSRKWEKVRESDYQDTNHGGAG
jgi:predicted dehydrogenase